MLDMGEPVRIVDLARDLITLSGLQPGRDIEIRFTGVRPGEKLTERLFLDTEDYEPTRHEKVFVCKGLPSLQGRELHEAVQALVQLAQRGAPPTEIWAAVAHIVPECAVAGETDPAIDAELRAALDSETA